ncbi:DUF2283 domain-containing protein [Candidatus Woesearchaeota archaeon]|nr:DUF2283 domain-containing protein [Candidatus Woesearchaeota archaeon]
MRSKGASVWDYSVVSDILNVHKAGAKVAASAELGDFTVDFNSEGTVVGLEIMHASDFFGSVSISKEDLSELREVDILTEQRNDIVLVMIRLLGENVNQVIPIPTPVLTQ